jgi:hypothetical protein
LRRRHTGLAAAPVLSRVGREGTPPTPFLPCFFPPCSQPPLFSPVFFLPAPLAACRSTAWLTTGRLEPSCMDTCVDANVTHHTPSSKP